MKGTFSKATHFASASDDKDHSREGLLSGSANRCANRPCFHGGNGGSNSSLAAIRLAFMREGSARAKTKL